MSLSEQQQRVIELVAQRENVFMTGPGGTGKSHVIRTVIKREQDAGRSVKVTAPTGVAAVNIDGITLHSFIAKDKPTDLLIIDEISMVTPDMFINEIVSRGPQQVRGDGDGERKPVLWKQLLLSGDFLQLPPVDPEKEITLDRKRKLTAKPTFVFETEQWGRIVNETVVLTRSYRQNEDTSFFDMLQRLRVGECSDDDSRALQQRVESRLPRGLFSVRLRSRRKDADLINQSELDALGDVETHVYAGMIERKMKALPNPAELLGLDEDKRQQAIDQFPPPSAKVLGADRAKLFLAEISSAKRVYDAAKAGATREVGTDCALRTYLADCALRTYLVEFERFTREWWSEALGKVQQQMEEAVVASRERAKHGSGSGPDLVLKVGARVMLTKNLDVSARLVNGTLGIVREFRPFTFETFITCRKCKKEGAEVKVSTDTSLFVCNTETCCEEFDVRDDGVRVGRGKFIAWGHDWCEPDEDELFPVIDFQDKDQRFSNRQQIGLRTDVQKRSIERVGKVVLRQLPLQLAWAVTIHKSQGMTVPHAEIDLGRSVFSDGQAYVALSRVETLAGVKLTQFDSRGIRANSKALEFYRLLQGHGGGAAASSAGGGGASASDTNARTDGDMIMGFGKKYPRSLVSEVARKDMGYLRWCAENLPGTKLTPHMRLVLPIIQKHVRKSYSNDADA